MKKIWFKRGGGGMKKISSVSGSLEIIILLSVVMRASVTG